MLSKNRQLVKVKLHLTILHSHRCFNMIKHHHLVHYIYLLRIYICKKIQVTRALIIFLCELNDVLRLSAEIE